MTDTSFLTEPNELNTNKKLSVSAVSQRADPLDALRGFAVLAMVLSGTITRKILPAWMYHAQEPPPLHNFNPQLPGLTWVDLVFPIFLFSMGAAIPLALSRRLAKGLATPIIILSIFQRGFLLGSFAIFLQHIRPTVINPNEPDLEKWWLALEGFLLLFLMFVRWPKSKFLWLGKAITIAAWIAGFIFVTHIQYPDGTGWSLGRSDIILIVLTNMAVFGSLSWLLTRHNWWLRLGLLGLLFALQLSSNANGWVKLLWNVSPVPWIFQWDYLKYLFIVIPGTIAGDMIDYWLEARADFDSNYRWHPLRFFAIMLLMLTITIGLLIGLQGRFLWQTTLVTPVLCAIGLLLFTSPGNATEKLLNRLYKWGFYWLVLGLLFEPYQGGIKKDPATVSYFFLTAGMAIMLLILMTVFIDVFKQKFWMQLFIDNGVNPMIGYVGFANIIWPILILNQWEPVIVEMTSTEPLKGFLRGFAYTFALACIVSIFTRLKLFLRT